ncbi:TetR/AcrR family transcriptional regulator [Corynebacterium flavescens]|uniref:TetR/AcrR family transcriptional regulator n=1 Tax=Corynebacterium flavescens TaxID=28028 RepID=UPI0026473FA3|nr:TetR/AcrR family transcriptional regulator [Corynebacterium flavescens]MDN6200352.1 TetR/AcrR family transcriptional regulator [Corynebacterium flavescens]
MANEQRRQQIAAAALDLFDSHGYHGTGMGDIAAAVGMRASSLYNHFRSKQELLAAVTISTMEELLRANAAALAHPSTPEEKLFSIMRTHVIFHATHAKRVRVVNAELHNLEDPSRAVVVQLRKDYVARWIRVVDSGDFSAEDLKIACWALIDMGIGVAQWYSPDGAYSPEELGDMYGRFALRQLGIET